MNNIKYFIKKLVVFLILMIIFDLIIGNMLEYFYFSERSLLSVDNKLNYSLNSTKEDVLIFGSSSANHGYIPASFEDSLGLSCYNVGFNGSNIYFYNTLLNSILQRHVPKIIILDLTAWELMKYKDDFEKLTKLYPFYYSNKSVKETVDLSSFYEKFKMLSKTYRFNSKLLSIIKHNIITSPDERKGYYPMFGRWKDDLVTDTLSVASYDSLKFVYLKKFINHASEKGSRVIIVASPAYRKYTKNQFSELEKHLNIKGIQFWNFRNDTSFLNHQEYFYDYVHLNDQGAACFTSKIIEKLKPIIEKSIN